MRNAIGYILLFFLPVLAAGCLCIPHQVSFFTTEVPAARKNVKCYVPAFPHSTAIEVSVESVTLQINHTDERIQVVICVPEGNTLSLDPHDIGLLSEDKVLVEKLNIVSMRIIDHTGQTDVTAESTVQIEGATKRILGVDGHRRLAFNATFTEPRPDIHYIRLPPLWINGTRVEPPLVKFTKRTITAC